MNTGIPTILMFILSITFNLPVEATDHDKEKRWARQISDQLVDGKPEWLIAEKQAFLSLYTATAMDIPMGAVILLHGRGLHPDWPQVIQPLRTQLPKKGWSTLSLQMPVLQNSATDEDYLPLFKEVAARIQAGLEFLNQQGLHHVVLIGHSLGSNMATDYLAKHHDPSIKAFVGIDMMGKPQPNDYLLLDNVAALLRLKVPMLDVYGSKTYPVILESVDRRAFAVHLTGNTHSRQIKINDANHFFQGHENELLQAISQWLTAFAMPQQEKKFASKNYPIHNK